MVISMNDTIVKDVILALRIIDVKAIDDELVNDVLGTSR